MTTERAQRPASVALLAILMGFEAITGLAGGGAMLVDPEGETFFSLSMLEGSPFDSFLIPGLVLFVLLGVVPAIVAWALLDTPRWSWLAPLERALGEHWAWAASAAVGLALLVFVVVQVATIPYDPGQLVYGIVGAAMVVLAALPDTRAYYRVRS